MSWSARQYLAFEDERTRPVRDLLGAVPETDARAVVDLGCGPGNSTEVLAARFPGAVAAGLDSSADMIEAARERLPALRFGQAASGLRTSRITPRRPLHLQYGARKSNLMSSAPHRCNGQWIGGLAPTVFLGAGPTPL